MKSNSLATAKDAAKLRERRSRSELRSNSLLRPKLSLIIIAAILLTALAAMSFCAKREGYGNLLLITPSAFGSAGLNPERLEELSEEEFLLTYEIKQPATAQAISSKHSVTLTGTNQNYAYIMGYPVLDGGFFTKSAWDAKNKHAVLNETAAFKIFGSRRISGQILQLEGEPWVIAGVVQDNDTENANVYAPSSVSGGQTGALMVLTDDGDVSEAYVKNTLKGVGIHENSYDFIYLSKSASAFGERFSVAWKSALFILILLFILKTGGGIIQKLRFYRNRLREIYFKELLVYHRADIAKAAAMLIFLISGAAAILLLSLNIFETCLTWQEIIPVTGKLTAGDFGERLVWLRDYYWVDVALFAAFAAVIAAYLFLTLNQKQHVDIGNYISYTMYNHEKAGVRICRKPF